MYVCANNNNNKHNIKKWLVLQLFYTIFSLLLSYLKQPWIPLCVTFKYKIFLLTVPHPKLHLLIIRTAITAYMDWVSVSID